MTEKEFGCFAELCVMHGLSRPVHEHRFSERRWRFDAAWPEHAVAMEQEGGFWRYGRHARGVGAEADMEKYNAAVTLGWRLLRFTPQQIRTGQPIRWLKILMGIPETRQEPE